MKTVEGATVGHDTEYMPTFADSMDTEVTKTRERYARLRREQMRFEAAVAAMQGMLSDCNYDEVFDACAKRAVKFANALLAELDRQQTKETGK